MHCLPRIRILSAAAALAFGSLVACSDNDNHGDVPKTASVRMIAINDFHGNLDVTGTLNVPDPNDATKTIKESVGGAAYLSTLITQLKQDHPLNVVVGAGDQVGASPLVSALFHDEPTIEALSAMGLEYTSVGNHEFDKGKTELKRLQNGGCRSGGVVGSDTCLDGGAFTGASFKYLAANVIDDATGKPLFDGYAIKTFEVGGSRIRIGFIGLVLKETPTIVTPDGVAGLTFKDEADTANALATELKQQGVNAIVVLIHQGIFTTVPFNDKSCAGASGDLLPVLDRLSSDIDVVVSGHTHWAYICKGQGTRNGKPLYASAGSYGRYATAYDLTIDTASGDITAVSADNKLVVNDAQDNPAASAYPTLAADAAIKTLVERYKTAAAPLTNKIVGRIGADLTRTQNGAGESTLGDVIADAQLAATQGDTQKAVAAFMNPGGIRADFQAAQISGGEAAGEITYGEAFTVQPFYNSLVTMTLSGAQIYTLLAQQWVGQTSPRFLQVSDGFAYAWDASQPDDKKIVDGSVTIGGLAIDKSKTYRVTVNSFLAGGGDNFKVLADGTERVGGDLDIDALVAWLGTHQPLAPPALNRIQRSN
ncbi:bifunctional metallophosphatase/5'-nucleotidase [Solimonas soli]|uniref:bifunctional metallophosphatase/5'-nucleotidase n=1 Tax=Solimonas soli TaxID=413479 RepID=UPI0005B9939C|nr:5'-nucleotidase C-terminal domain-containing protein [Solimonas soli]